MVLVLCEDNLGRTISPPEVWVLNVG